MRILTFSHYKSIELEQKNKYYLRFLKSIEDNIQDFYKEIEQAFINKYGNSNDNEFYDAMYDEIREEIGDYDFTLYSSFIMAIYSFLEQTLNDICKHYEKELKSTIRITDLKGDGIERSYLFLTKIVGVEKSKLNVSWSKIQDLNKIRNLVVHRGISEIKEVSNDNLGKQITRAKELGLFKTFPIKSNELYYGRLYLNYNYCDDSLKQIKIFMFTLLEILPDVPFVL